MFNKNRRIAQLEAQIDVQQGMHYTLNRKVEEALAEGARRDQQRFELERSRSVVEAQRHAQLAGRIALCEAYIPASYGVEEYKGLDSAPCWMVIKNHPILGRFESQKFPTKGCAEKSLKDHFILLEFRQVW